LDYIGWESFYLANRDRQSDRQMINANRFLYNKETKTFSADVSDIGTSVFEQIYSDAADEGLTLWSEKSGLEATYYLDHVNYSDDTDHELVSWELKPTTETIRKHPQLRDTMVLIFND
jgi:hypothetical protein